MNTESYIELTVNAFRVLSQAVADAGCIVGFAVQNAFKGLRFTLVRADNFELYVTKSLRQFRYEKRHFYDRKSYSEGHMAHMIWYLRAFAKRIERVVFIKQPLAKSKTQQ